MRSNIDHDFKLIENNKDSPDNIKIDENIQENHKINLSYSVEQYDQCALDALKGEEKVKIDVVTDSFCKENLLVSEEVADIAVTAVTLSPKVTEEETNIEQDSRNPESDSCNGSENTETSNDWMHLSKGRYFGIAEDEVICHKCGEPGHILRECSQEMCTNCGTVNDHLASRCPMLQRCHNCNELGHILVDCKKPWKSNTCSLCNSKYHPNDMCPKIWRCYIFSPNAPKDFKPKRYCYNCAEYGHYGDDCRLPQCSKYMEPSAFRIDNEPVSASEYAYLKHQEKIKKKRALQAYKEEERDDWFAQKMKRSSNHKSSRSNTFSKSNPYCKISNSNRFYNKHKEILYGNTHKRENSIHDKKHLKKDLNKKESIYINVFSH
ncbi:uncharacterized protein T551_02085 [Pneumocystis jirovecii RU7]|uniref:CCHC-type domain-containing protein n=1 Tax=Pneumocystis jirovecii (strain RU7) TaxID=1408657 RepID=A0A0W4ZM59_PNEJ7|nr:uncharacterized protein T551_02085 [Pneumocystis jirovecii RU7]KTW29469.1 hypothetical protein T551_02085 [Pneumocystis jirovecii RU7]